LSRLLDALEELPNGRLLHLNSFRSSA
jgi:hypothetical protein